jgi:hypothetical protein
MDNDFQALKHLILDKTQGTPFFMEEIVQELREQGLLTDPRRVGSAHQYLDLHLPPTVQAVLAARIDRLTADEKALLQQLAVIGRQFPLSLIRYVITQPEADLYRLLASLQRKEFLYEQPAFPESEYLFKHALTQDVAYGTVLQEQKKLLHERTGQAIERLYQDKLDEQYEALAHHYSKSGNTGKAIEYLTTSGKHAVRQSANAEAILALTAALELLSAQPASDARAHQEIELLLTLGGPLRATKGYAAPEVEKTYTRARELSRQIGNPRFLFAALRGLWGVHNFRGEGDKMQALGEEILGLMQTLQESALLLEGHHTLVTARNIEGEFAKAYEHAQKGCDLYDPGEHHALVYLYGQDPRVGCLAYGAWSLWFLGYPEHAGRWMEEALRLHQQIVPPLSQAVFLNAALTLHMLSRDTNSAAARVEALATLAAEHVPAWFEVGLFWKGWALTQRGEMDEGVKQMRQAFTLLEGAGFLRLTIAPALVEAYRKAQRYEEGLLLVTEILAVANSMNLRIVVAELYRLKGELLLMQADQLKE